MSKRQNHARPLRLEPLESRVLLSQTAVAVAREVLHPAVPTPPTSPIVAAQVASTAQNTSVTQKALPTKIGQVFPVQDWDNVVTRSDLDTNYTGSRNGIVSQGVTAAYSPSSFGSTGGSLDLSFDFTGLPRTAFAGYFLGLAGQTNSKGSYLDTKNIYGDFLPWAGRSVQELRFNANLISEDGGTSTGLKMKVELKDQNNSAVSVYRPWSGGGWMSFSVPLSGFAPAPGSHNPAAFDWRHVTTVSFIIEQNNDHLGVHNPGHVRFLLDNLGFADLHGSYPDLTAASDATGQLQPRYQNAFLDTVRETSSLYFLDYSSGNPATGGMIQDRSTFADLLSVGGVGSQLTSYVIDARQGYLTRAEAAQRVLDILTVLNGQPQGPQPVGTIGYNGFFYRYLGTDGLRKQDAAPNTVELSTIDTALAIAGTVTTGQYFTANNPIEAQIRTLANAIYGRVDWHFMLNTAPGPNQNQLFLGWIPNEPGGPLSGYQIPDASATGDYSSKPGGAPLTIDYYTDEGLLAALLAMGSPNPAHRLGREVWDALIRDTGGGSFVKSYPGSLFTYQVFSQWVDTQRLGSDNQPGMPVDWFQNTSAAIQATIAYATANPKNEATLNSSAWGLSACNGPFGNYTAYAAPPAAVAPDAPEFGTVTNYAVGSSILAAPDQAIQALWYAAHLDLNGHGWPYLLNPLSGFADAYNLNIADEASQAANSSSPVLRTSGPWADFTGFAIDQGPLQIMMDNYLENNFVPDLFMSHPGIAGALGTLFPSAAQPRYLGPIPVGTTAVVNVYDCDPTADVKLADIQVVPGRGNTIASITLAGTDALGGLGLVISGASSVGPITDTRRSAPADIAFIASTCPITSIQLKTGITGYNLNGLAIAGLTFAPDIDGDGSTSDLTGLLVNGNTGSVTLGGGLPADLVVKGNLTSLKDGGNVAGDIRVGGTLGSVTIAGSLTGGTWSVPGKDGPVSIGHVLAPITLGDVASVATSSPLVREVQGGVPVDLIAVETVNGAATVSRIQFHSIGRWPKTVCDAATPAGPLVPGDVLGGMALASLKSHFAASGLGTWTGDPSKLKPGLLASFGPTNDPTYQYVKGVAYVYDEALAIEALLEGSAPDAESRARAFQIADALVLLQDHDPLNASAHPDPTFPGLTPAPLRDSYLSGVVANSRTSTVVTVRSNTTIASSGNQAYVALALQRAATVATASGDTARASAYLRTAKELLLYVGRNREKSGPLEGFTMSNSPTNGQVRSTENNIDLTMAFGRLAAAETDPTLKTQWAAWRDWAAYFQNQMYGGNPSFGNLTWISANWQYFRAGTGLGDDINYELIPIDTGAWSALELGDNRAVAFTLIQFLAHSTDATGRVYPGFDPGFVASGNPATASDRDGIGAEATAYMALIARERGDAAILTALPSRASLTTSEQAAYDAIVAAASGAGDQNLANSLIGDLANIQLHAPNTDGLGLVAAPVRNVGTGEYSLVNGWSLASTSWTLVADKGWDIFTDSVIA